MDIIKKYWVILVAGLLIRIAVSALTYHPDINYQVIASAAFFNGAPNPYEKAGELVPGTKLDKPPMSYFLILPFHLLARPLVSGNTEELFFINHQLVLGKIGFWFYMIYSKLPHLVFDMMLGLALAFLVSQNHQKKVLALWMFNPMTIWASEAIGQLDIFPTFFIVLCLFLIKKAKMEWAALSLGLGGAIKIAPFLLLPFFLGLADSKSKVIKLFLLAIIPYVLTNMLYISSSEFRNNALFAPQLSKSLYANIPISGGATILVVPAILIFLYIWYFLKKRSVDKFFKFSLCLLLLTLAFTHFHIQWFLWVSAFLLIFLKDNWGNGVSIAAFGLLISLVLMLFLFDSSLQIQLFRPILPSLDQAKGLAEILSPERVIFWRSFAASIFAASSLFLIWMILKKELRR